MSLSEIAAATHSGSKKPQPALVDLWVEGRMENYGVTGTEVGNSDGNLGVLYLGTRSMLGSDILVGALAQLDRGVETTQHGPAEMAATGWMAGPYMSMKLGSGVVFDGRAAWGTTENAVPGEELNTTESERSLVRAKLTGTREVEGWKVAPSVGVVYLEDAVRDGASGEATAQGAGRVEVLPEVSRRFEVNSETYVEPRAAVGGFLGFDDFTALNHTITTDGRGRCAVESGGRRRRRREGRHEPASYRRRRERHCSNSGNVDGTAATERSALEMSARMLRCMMRCIQFSQHSLYECVMEIYYGRRIRTV